MTKTITIQIGNTDDKLSQVQWSKFVRDVDWAADAHADATHFAGGSLPDKPWQNFCWVIEVKPDMERGLIRALVDITQKYGQDSIAYTSGRTHFLKP